MMAKESPTMAHRSQPEAYSNWDWVLNQGQTQAMAHPSIPASSLLLRLAFKSRASTAHGWSILHIWACFGPSLSETGPQSQAQGCPVCGKISAIFVSCTDGKIPGWLACFFNADKNALYMLRITNTDSLLLLFSFSTVFSNTWLWNKATELPDVLQFLYKSEIVSEGKHPRGCIFITAIFRTPKPWMRCRFKPSCLIIDLVKADKPYRGTGIKDQQLGLFRKIKLEKVHKKIHWRSLNHMTFLEYRIC